MAVTLYYQYAYDELEKANDKWEGQCTGKINGVSSSYFLYNE